MRRPLIAASMIAVLVACGGVDSEVNVAAWCRQLDLTVTASAETDVTSGADDALEAARSAGAVLADLEPPPAIAEDVEIVMGPPPTNSTGGFELDEMWAEAGARVVAWTVEHCDLSTDSRAVLDTRRSGEKRNGDLVGARIAARTVSKCPPGTERGDHDPQP